MTKFFTKARQLLRSYWQATHVLCKGGHVCAYLSDVGLDLWIKEQNDRLRMTIEAFTKIFNYLSKCLKLGLLVNDPLQIRRIPLKRLSIHFYYCYLEQAPFNQVHFDA